MSSPLLLSQSRPGLYHKLPPEILGIILSYLGKHDLLNARFVSHIFNDESLKVLRKSKFTKELSEQTIMEYVLFPKPAGSEPFIIPFHLNFKINLVPSGALSLKTLTPYVNSLYQICGPNCVSTLSLTNNDTVSTEEEMNKTGLIEFLALISPGLKTLDLTRFNSRIYFLNTNQNQILYFPKLKKLICNTGQSLPRDKRLDQPYISIIENSPILQELTLTNACDLEDWPLKFNQLKSLSLDTMLNLQNLLIKIRASSGTPIMLRELSLRDDVRTTPGDKIVVYHILKAISPTLKSFKIREHTGPLFRRDAGISRIMRFPKLRHLEHLGLEYNVRSGEKYVLTSEDINLNEETFPSLKSIELPIGFIFSPSSLAESERGEDTRIEFPNIEIKLRVNSAPGPEYLNGTLGHLQKIFPTPSKLSLVNVGGNDFVKYILNRIIKSNWSENIQEFGMIGFDKDYFGQVLHRLEFNPRVVLENCGGDLEVSMRNEFLASLRRMDMECEWYVEENGFFVLTRVNQSEPVKMTNLTAIKLQLIDKPSYDPRSSYSSSIIPNLIGMAKQFPQLRMIEISEFLFPEITGKPRQDKPIRRRRFEEFKSQFPGCVLNLT